MTKLAEKSILYKPYVIKKLYRLSTSKRKEIVENTIEKYTNENNLSKKDKLNLKRDMVYCRVHYNLSFKEYFLFGFKNKSHLKRKNFITNMNRQNYLYMLGEKEGQEILNDKYKTYEILKKFYKRDIIKINNENFKEFNDYIKKHPTFVKKPIDSSFGKGIELRTQRLQIFKKIIFICPRRWSSNIRRTNHTTQNNSISTSRITKHHKNSYI